MLLKQGVPTGNEASFIKMHCSAVLMIKRKGQVSLSKSIIINARVWKKYHFSAIANNTYKELY